MEPQLLDELSLLFDADVVLERAPKVAAGGARTTIRCLSRTP